MENIKLVSDFFNADLPNYAAYDNTRKLASNIDGLKISARKIIYTLFNKYNNSTEKIKTDTVSNVCAAYTNYLHGAANLSGVCNTLAQNFVTANNFPLLDGNSSGFGTRINPICAASRYTKVSISDVARKLFKEDDFQVIEKQFFEGSYIEPRFFIPIFPVIFLNGSDGLSTGFSQTIYPRNPLEIIEYIKNVLSNKKLNNIYLELKPWFKGHTGKVVLDKVSDKILSYGTVSKVTSTKYIITELPIGYTYNSYLKVLDRLCDTKIILDYIDLCDTKNDSIKFEIKTTKEFALKYDSKESLLEVFKLIKSLPETLCCIDENNRVKEYNSIREILDDFIMIRLDFYQKRKKYQIKELEDKINLLTSKLAFCNAIANKQLDISNKSKLDIESELVTIKDIITINDSYDYLLNLPIHSISIETINKCTKDLDEYIINLNKLKQISIESMWLFELADLEKYFKKLGVTFNAN